MINIQCFTFNPFQENTYLLINENKQCFIIDPGMYEPEETATLIRYIEKEGLQPLAIINTHAHIDHIFGLQAIKDRYNIPFGLHEKDLPVLENAAVAAMMFGFEMQEQPKPDFFIKENEPIKLGDDTLEVRFTPGHSPGSVIFYYAPGNFAIGGDVLFAGSVGRTDLPGGSFPILYDSIKNQLFTLPGNTVIHPGHGPTTTIEEENTNNQFLK
jgi:hydroxyacylglutathione hydrolase